MKEKIKWENLSNWIKFWIILGIIANLRTIWMVVWGYIMETIEEQTKLETSTESLKLIKNTKGYNWEIKILFTDVDRIENINNDNWSWIRNREWKI